MKKYFVIALLLAVMIVSIAVIDSRSMVAQPAADRPDDGTRIYASGVVEGATEDVHLRVEESGRVVQVLVADGDWVEAGDVLVRLDDSRHRQRVAAAEAHLELAGAQLQRLLNGARSEERDEARALYRAKQARLDQELRTWKRIQELSLQRAVPQQEADDQHAMVQALTAELEAAHARVQQLIAPARDDEVRVAQARVAAARADFELAQIALDKTALRTPSRGQVLDVHTEPGEFTGPDTKQPIVVLADTSAIHVRAYIEEIDAPRVQLGMAAAVLADGLPDEKFTGTVIFISPRMRGKAVHADRPGELYDTTVREVLVKLDHSQNLIVGLRVDVMLDAASDSPAPAAEQTDSAATETATETPDP